MEHTLMGRQLEIDMVNAFVGRLETSPAVLVITGACGIGKSAVFSSAIRSLTAAGVRVVSLDALNALVQGPGAAGPVPQLAGDVARRLGLASEERVVLAADDWQQAPEPARSVLAHLAARLRARAGVLLTCGPDALPLRHDDLETGGYWHVTLAPLSAAAIRTLVNRRLGGPADATVIDRIAEIAQGNPRIALQLAEAAASGRAPRWAWDDLALSRPLADVAERRIARVEPSLLPIMESLAVLGRVSAGEAASLGLGERSLHAAVAAGHVAIDAAGAMRVRDPLVALALAAAGGPQRRALHVRAASVLIDPDERARHLALATEGPDSAVAAALEGAALRAAAAGRPRLAGELAGESVGRTPAPEVAERVRRVLHAARALALAGDVPAARVALGEQPGLAAATLAVQLSSASPATLERRLERVLDGAGPADQVLVRESLAWLRGIRSGRLEEGIAAGREAVAAAEHVDDAAVRTRAFTTLGALNALGARAGADTLLRRAAAAGGEMLLAPAARPAAWLALRHLWRGELAPARRLLEEQLALAVRLGAEPDRVLLLAALAQADLYAGELVAATARLDEAAVTRSGAPRELSAWALAVRASLRSVTEEQPAGRDAAIEAAAVAAIEGDWLAGTLAGAELGRAALVEGRFVDAREHLDEVTRDLLRRGLAEPGVFRVAPDRIAALVATGDVSAAARCASSLARRAAALDHPWARAAAARCDARVRAARGDIDAGADGLRAAIVAYEAIGHRLDAAWTARDLAGVLLEARRKRQAAEAFADAAERFGALGAPAWARSLTDAARAAHPRVDGPVALTPSEERIAALVLGGCSNKEIALRLRTTVTAIEAHLSRMYRKRGVRSRGQLVAQMASPDSLEVAA